MICELIYNNNNNNQANDEIQRVIPKFLIFLNWLELIKSNCSIFNLIGYKYKYLQFHTDMTKLFLTVLVVFCSISISVAETNRDKIDPLRNLESAVQSNDDLGKFYYPVSLLKLPKDQEQVLTPLNRKSGEKYLYF